MTNNKIALVLAACSILIAFTVNEVNLDQLRKDKVELRENQTVITTDDGSYIKYFRIFVETGSIYRNEYEKYDSIIRLPGYGIFYGVTAKLFGVGRVLPVLKIFQLLFFGLSVYCLFFIAVKVLTIRIFAVLAAGVYGLLPFSMGFLYYTLTEAITPALLIFYIFFLFKASAQDSETKKQINYFIASLVFSYLFLTRPFLGIFGLAIPCFLYVDFFERKKLVLFLSHAFFYGAVSVSLMLVWQARNYSLTGNISGLNPIYQNEMPGTFRKTHKAIWNLFKGWESKGDHFHETIVPLWESAIKGDTSKYRVDAVIARMPAEVVNFFGRNRLDAAFKNYQLSTLFQKQNVEDHKLLPAELPAIEQTVIDTFSRMETEYKHHFWFRYHIVTPLKVFGNLTFHSNLSLYIFQKTYRGDFFMEALRLICFSIHVSVFLLCLLFIFFSKDIKLISLFALPVLFYIFYLVYIQRGIEERYTLPILPLVILSATFVLLKIINRKTLFTGSKG
jgi:hypothetical protein